MSLSMSPPATPEAKNTILKPRGLEQRARMNVGWVNTSHILLAALTGPTFQGRKRRRDSLTAWVVIRWIVSFTYFKVARLIPINYGARRQRVRYFVFAIQILQLLRPQHQVRLQQNQSNIRAGEMANLKWRNRLHWGRDDALCCTSTTG